MRFLLDTSIVSEPTRKAPNPEVLWRVDWSVTSRSTRRQSGMDWCRGCGVDREDGSPVRPGSGSAPGGQVATLPSLLRSRAACPGTQSARRRATPLERCRECTRATTRDGLGTSAPRNRNSVPSRYGPQPGAGPPAPVNWRRGRRRWRVRPSCRAPADGPHSEPYRAAPR